MKGLLRAFKNRDVFEELTGKYLRVPEKFFI
jgi:hypothetical protein